MIAELRQRDLEIQFYWIKGHVGIPGNERADELAKDAALKLKPKSAYDCFPLALAKRSIRAHTLRCGSLATSRRRQE